MKNSDMPAMPLTGDAYTDISGYKDCPGIVSSGMGLTKREHFAGLAMQGVLSNSFLMKDIIVNNENADDISKLVSRMSEYHADALLKQLGEGNE